MLLFVVQSQPEDFAEPGELFGVGRFKKAPDLFVDGAAVAVDLLHRGPRQRAAAGTADEGRLPRSTSGTTRRTAGGTGGSVRRCGARRKLSKNQLVGQRPFTGLASGMDWMIFIGERFAQRPVHARTNR